MEEVLKQKLSQTRTNIDDNSDRDMAVEQAKEVR